MSTGTRVDLGSGRTIAAMVTNWLAPACERVEVAGSIRRGKADVGDIELVVIPKVTTEPDGMFGERTVNQLTERLDMIIAYGGRLASHPTDPKRGDRYSKVIHAPSGLQVDLFSATARTFGLILLIRTGPAAYSQRFVTDIRKAALHVASGELHRGSLGCGSIGCEVIPTPEEIDVYAAAKRAYLRPEHRE